MSAPRRSERASLRIATWNIHGFKGEGPRPDPERTLRVIRALDADVLALQEVDGRANLGRLPQAFERLADGLGGHLADARLFGKPGSEYGHLVWSRQPVASFEIRTLPGPGLEPRAVVDAQVETRLGPLRVLAVHFGLDPRARRRQADALASLVRAYEPTLALGDFNEWRMKGGVHRRLAAILPNFAQYPTWPSGRPVACLDRIYASTGIRIERAYADADAAPASDHRPLVADIRF